MTPAKFLRISSVGIVLLLVSILFLYPIPLDILNSDLGRHILLGEIIISSGSVPTTNLLSYTNPDYPFINTHWFSQVLFSIWYGFFGFDGLIVLSVLLALITTGVVFLYSIKRHEPVIAAIIALIYLQAIGGRTQVRPELFSFLFLSIFSVILYRYKEKYTRWIYALIPLMLLWVNTHIYFFAGVGITILFLIDAFISDKKHLHTKKFQTLMITTLAVCGITLINPNFLKGAVYPLFVLNDYGLALRENVNFYDLITKHQSAIKPSVIFFVISMGILWTSLLAMRKKMAPVDFLVAAFFTFVGLVAIRNFPLFVFGTFIPCVTAVSYLYHRVMKQYHGNALIVQAGLLIATCVAIIPSVIWNIESHGSGLGVTDNIAGAITFWEKNNLKGPIYNNYDIGNYLEYRLYPKEQVYIDNRPEAYPKEFLQNTYLPMQKSAALFAKEDATYNFNAVILAHTDVSSGTKQLMHRLVRDDNWKLVYINSIAVIFLKNTPDNHQVIAKYGMDQKNIKIAAADADNKNKTSQLINFFKTVDWPQQFLQMNLHHLKHDPKNCAAIYNILFIYKSQNLPLPATYTNQYLEHCNSNAR